MLTVDVTLRAFAELGHVRRVLAGWSGPELDFNAVFTRGAVPSPKVRAFVDFLVERLNFDADYMRVLCPDMAREMVCESMSGEVVTDEARILMEANLRRLGQDHGAQGTGLDGAVPGRVKETAGR